MEIKDKVVIVTGASGGIGSAVSKYLAREGARLVLAALSEEKLTELEREIPGSLTVPTDVRKSEDVKNLVERAIEKHGRVDILINLAGQGMWAPVEKIDVEEYKKLFDLNVVFCIGTPNYNIFNFSIRQSFELVQSLKPVQVRIYLC